MPTSFSTVWDEVIDGTCTGCHGSTGAGGLSMPSERDAYTELLADYVVAGDPTRSELYDRITRSGGGLFSGIMPPAPMDSLSDEQIALVERWITEGAVE